jgi:multiple sugar transport system permease protein
MKKRGLIKIFKNLSLKLFLYIILSIIGLIMIGPYLWMISTSLKEYTEVFRFPPTLIPHYITLDNYRNAFDAVPLGQFFINSLFISITVTLLVLFITSLAGYALARLKFHGKEIIFYTILAILMIPGIVTIIPNFILVKNLGLFDTYLGLILPYVTWNLPIATFMFRSYFEVIPQSLEDAARLDGCSEFEIYWKIMLPLAKPALATVAIFTFLFGWDEFVWALTATSTTSMRTLPVGLALFIGRYETAWNLLCAGSVVATIPVTIFFLLLQKHFMSALAFHIVK